jgi:hypothetical protein
LESCINTSGNIKGGNAMSIQYYGIENLGLNALQKATLVDALKQIGDNHSPYPNHRNHWRVRLDNDAVIFEGKFSDEDWTADSVKNKLANIFGVNPATIGDSTQSTQYGPVVTYSRGGDKLRLIAFGGLLASWEESHDKVLAFLADNRAEWESPE